MGLHVERSIQFRSDLYKKSDKKEWFVEVGNELAKRKLSITVAPGISLKNADDVSAFMKRYASDKTGLQAAINLPAGVTLANYVQDLVQALDDTVKTTSDVANSTLDLSPQSDFSKLLGLDSSSRYASSTTNWGKSASKVFQIAGIEVTDQASAVDPLAGQLYIDAKTFANMPAYQWNRDGVELEQVSGVAGVDAQELLAALRSTNNNGRSAFQRLRRPELMEAYSLGYAGVGLDDMRWDGDAHEMREKNKFVSLTIESGRYDAPAAGQPREISVGTDKMDDTYYDTNDFRLMDNDFSVRGRARWDTDTEIRRLLVQVKSNTVIDDFGMKRNGKVDVRNDGASAEEIANLDRDVRVGSTSWNGGTQPLGPLKGVYDALNKNGALPDIGPHQDVMQLEPKAHLRSVRSRYHLNETPLSSMQTFYTQTTGKLDSVLALATGVQGSVTGADKTTVDALVKSANGIKDLSAIVTAVEAQLKALDPAMTVNADTVKALLPTVTNTWNAPKPDALTIQKKRVVADALDGAYHAFSQQLDGARRIITGSQDRTYENYASLYMAFQKATDTSMVGKNTYDPFLAKIDASLAATPADAGLKAFNEYGLAQKAGGNRDFRRFEALPNVDAFKALRQQVLNEVVRINQRQLEAGGSMALGLWFEEARAFFVPQSRRNTGNFIIDTTDMSEYLKHDAWESIPADQRTPANVLPADKIFHVSLVNETQIELGEEKAYLDRMDALLGQIDGDRASLVMKYFDTIAQPGVVNTDAASYATAVAALLKKPAAARDSEIKAINAFLKQQKSGLEPLTAKTLGQVDASAFSIENRDKAVRTDSTVEANLTGATFIFQQLIDVQKAVVAAKEERVVDVLEGAGLNDVEWKQTETSKGVTALQKLRTGQV